MGREAFPDCVEKTIENRRITECVFVDRGSGTKVDDGENVLRPDVRYRVFGNKRRTVEMDQQSKGSAPCRLTRNEDVDGLCQQTVNGYPYAGEIPLVQPLVRAGVFHHRRRVLRRRFRQGFLRAHTHGERRGHQRRADYEANRHEVIIAAAIAVCSRSLYVSCPSPE